MKSETAVKYTPGPWHVAAYELTGCPNLVHNAVGQCIADCNGNLYVTDENKEANAVLIAAAPDLLEACKGAVANLDSLYPSDHIVMKRLRAAITKATNHMKEGAK